MADRVPVQNIVQLEVERKARDVQGSPRRFFYYLKTQKWLYLMMIPAAVGLFIFSYIPMYGVIIAFQRYNVVRGFLKSPWVGFLHFKNFFSTPYAFRIIRNTFLLSFWSMVFGFPAPILLALFLNEVRSNFFRRFTQAISYLPHFISTVIMVGILYKLVGTDGLVNDLIALLGFSRIGFRLNPGWFRFLFVTSGIWQEVGWGTIIYLASIASVNPELYEVGRMDGSNRIGLMIHVTLPSILPTIIILLIFRISRLLSVGFEKVYLMYNPAIYETSDIIATYVFRRGIEGGEFSFATAVGLFNSVVAFVLLFLANLFAKKFSEYSLW